MKIPSSAGVRTRTVRLLAAATGVILAGGVAFAATNWTVGLASGSSAASKGAAIASLTIGKVTTVPSLTDQLYPGGTGDVQFVLTNPNPFPVTVSSVTLPIESTTSNAATGYSDSTTSNPIGATCGATTSTVTWKAATTSNLMEQLGSPFTVANGATITVTLTNDATMDATAPLACAGTSSGTAPNLTYAGAYFVLPSLYTVGATGGTYATQPAVIANGGTVTTGY